MNVDKLLRPSSVAVIGASADTSKVGNNVLENIAGGGYAGKIYPVNPRADEIRGMKCYRSILDIKDPVDLAVIAVRRELVASVLRECAARGIEAAIIITAGFAETGEEGKRLQDEVAQIARQNRMALLGPNCLGLINPWVRLNASFGQAAGEPGSIALISQSGALITAIQDMAARSRIGFSLLASIGNKATLDEVEFLHILQRDEKTSVIAAYLEVRSSCAWRSAPAKASRSSFSRRDGPRPGQRRPRRIRAVLRDRTAPTRARSHGPGSSGLIRSSGSSILPWLLPVSLFQRTAGSPWSPTPVVRES
jgi:acyl-CoA synthetase (NDP forming)